MDASARVSRPITLLVSLLRIEIVLVLCNFIKSRAPLAFFNFSLKRAAHCLTCLSHPFNDEPANYFEPT